MARAAVAVAADALPRGAAAHEAADEMKVALKVTATQVAAGAGAVIAVLADVAIDATAETKEPSVQKDLLAAGRDLFKKVRRQVDHTRTRDLSAMGTAPVQLQEACPEVAMEQTESAMVVTTDRIKSTEAVNTVAEPHWGNRLLTIQKLRRHRRVLVSERKFPAS